MIQLAKVVAVVPTVWGYFATHHIEQEDDTPPVGHTKTAQQVTDIGLSATESDGGTNKSQG